MAIIGAAEVEVRADVRKLGTDIKDSFNDLAKTADDIADKMGKSIGDSLKSSLDGLTIKINIDDSILDEIIEIEEQIDRISNKTIKIDLDDSAMDKVNTYHGKTLRYDVDLDTTYLDAQLAKIADQKIDLKVDNKSAKAIKDSVEKTVLSLPAASRTVSIGMDIDSGAMDFLNEEMKKAMEGVQRVANKHAEPIDLELNTDQLMEHLEMLKDYETEDIEQGITIDQTDLDEINSAIEALRQYNQANAIELEAELHMAKVMAQLALLTRKRFVEIVPKINAKAMAIAQGTLAGFTGFNIMKDHTKDFIKSLTELDKQLPQTALLLTALSAVVPAAGWGAGTLMMLVGDIAALSGLAVPGAAIMTAYGASVFFMNNAFEQQNKKKYIPQITAQLGELSSAIAGDFWAVAEPSYNNFAFKTLPSIYSAAKGVNTGMAQLSSSFWDSIGAVIETDRGMGNLTETSRNIERGMMGLSGAFYPAMQGMLTFVRAGSKYLPELGDHIETLALQFDAWVMTMDESGALDEWALAGKNALLDLGSIIVSTVEIFYSLYQIANNIGFPGLSELADGLAKVNENLKSEGTITALTQLGTATKTAFDTMASSLSWIGPVISSNFDGIVITIGTMGDIMAEVFGGIGDMFTNTDLVPAFLRLFDSMKNAITTFRPAFESIGTIMAVTFDFIGSAMKNIAPILEQFFLNLAHDAEYIKPSFMGMLDIIGEWGPKVMEVVGVVTNAVAQWIGNLDPVFALAGIALIGLGGVFVSVGSAIIGAFVWVDDIIGKIDKLLLAFGKSSSASGILTGGLKGLGGGVGSLITRITSLIPGIGWIVSAFISAFAASEELRTAVGTFLGNAFKTLLAFIQPVIVPIGTLFSTLMSGLDQVAAAVAPAFTGLFNAINSLMPVIQLVAHFLGAVLGGAIKTLSTILGSAFNTISTVVGGIANIIGGAFNAISSVITGVIGIVKGLISGDMSAVADAAKGMWDGLKDAWTQMLDGAINAVVGVFTGAFDSVASAVKGLFEGALHVLDTFDLFPQAQAIIQSLIDGFSNAIDGVRQWLQDLTQKIIEWKGPPSTDATLLNDAGASIIQSLIDGFMSAVGKVMTFLQDLTQKILDAVLQFLAPIINIFMEVFGPLIDFLAPIIQAIVNIIKIGFGLAKSIIEVVMNTIWSVIQMVWNTITTIFTTAVALVQGIIKAGMAIIQAIFTGDFQAIPGIIQAVWDMIVTTAGFVWNLILSTISTVLQMIWNTIQSVFNTISAFISLAWNTVLAIIGVIWNAIWTTITTVATAIWNTIVVIFTAIWTTITTIVTTIWNTITTIFTAIWTTISTIVTTIWNTIVTIFTAIWTTIVTIVTTIWNSITTTFNSIRTTITIIITAVRDWLTNTWNNIKTTVVNAVNSLRDSAVNTFNSLKDRVVSAVTTLRDNAVNAVNNLKDRAVNAATSLRDTAVNAFNSLKDRAISAVTGLRDRAVDAFNNVKDRLKSAAETARDTVVNAFQSLKDRALDKISNLLSDVSAIPGKIKSALGDLGSLLTSAGRDVIQGLINGVTDKISSLRGKLSEVTNLIPEWKGPPDTDATLLTNAGELIMEGLISGLESKYGAVKNSLQTFTGDLSQTVGTQIGADVGVTTSVRQTALSEAERRLSYRSGDDSMVQSNNGEGVHIHFHQAFVNTDEVIMAVNRELGRG